MSSFSLLQRHSKITKHRHIMHISSDSGQTGQVTHPCCSVLGCALAARALVRCQTLTATAGPAFAPDLAAVDAVVTAVQLGAHAVCGLSALAGKCEH
jgi:hypothetical protein